MLRSIVLTPLALMLTQLIRLADAAYRAGVPLMPDAAFDALSRLAPNALPPLTTLLSLDCHPEPEDWLERHPGPYAVQLKADGVSVNLVYEDGIFVHAHLRGGRDCTDAAIRAGALSDLPGKPPGRVEVRCEAIGRLAPPQQGGHATQPPTRNAVAAALRRNGPTDNVALSLLAFDLTGIDTITTQTGALTWLRCAGFACLDCIESATPAEVMQLFDAFCCAHHSLPFACDGLTVKLNSRIQQRQLGNDSRAPRWAISLKP
jgi:DNA ligase (NAD+)